MLNSNYYQHQHQLTNKSMLWDFDLTYELLSKLVNWFYSGLITTLLTIKVREFELNFRTKKQCKHTFINNYNNNVESKQYFRHRHPSFPPNWPFTAAQCKSWTFYSVQHCRELSFKDACLESCKWQIKLSPSNDNKCRNKQHAGIKCWAYLSPMN